MRWDDRGEQDDPAGRFRLVDTDDGDIDVMMDDAPQYRIERRPRRLVDFVPTCWWQQTSPDSHFTRSLMCSRSTETGRVTLSGERLITTDHGVRSERTLDGDDAVRDAYRTIFGIELDRLPRVKKRTVRSNQPETGGSYGQNESSAPRANGVLERVGAQRRSGRRGGAGHVVTMGGRRGRGRTDDRSRSAAPSNIATRSASPVVGGDALQGQRRRRRVTGRPRRAQRGGVVLGRTRVVPHLRGQEPEARFGERHGDRHPGLRVPLQRRGVGGLRPVQVAGGAGLQTLAVAGRRHHRPS